MDELKIWLGREHGLQVQLAHLLGVKPPVVNAWLSNRRPLPMRHAAAIEQFTGGAITRQHMFPRDWARIWPELADAPTAEPATQTEQGVA